MPEDAQRQTLGIRPSVFHEPTRTKVHAPPRYAARSRRSAIPRVREVCDRSPSATNRLRSDTDLQPTNRERTRATSSVQESPYFGVDSARLTADPDSDHPVNQNAPAFPRGRLELRSDGCLELGMILGAVSALGRSERAGIGVGWPLGHLTLNRQIELGIWRLPETQAPTLHRCRRAILASHSAALW